MALEGVEVAQRRRAQDRRPEGEVGGAEDGRVVVIARLEPVDEVAQRLDPEAAREVVVERRERASVDGGVVLERRSGADGAPTARTSRSSQRAGASPGVERDGQSPARTRRREPLADVGDLHAAEFIRASSP